MDEKLTINTVGDFTNPYQQTYPDTCAIKSQQLIMNEFGIPVSEDQCVAYSMEQGWYSADGTGTQCEDVGKLLVDSGIPCTQRCEANVYDLANELAQGHKVIVGVDSGELWNGGFMEWLKDFFLGDTPDHALIVAGIDMSDPNNPMVVVTDPGTGDCAKSYPLDQFMDAWSDSQCYMVSTDVAAPQQTEQMLSCGLTDGHLEQVAGVDYDTFTQFQDYSHQIDYVSQGPQLYDMFQNYPSMPDTFTFNDALFQYDMPLPSPDAMLFPPQTSVNPFSFDYTDLSNTDWLGMPGDDFSTDFLNEDFDNDKHSLLDKMQDNLDFAHEHAQQCMDDGMYISGTIWENQANDIENDINEILNSDI